MHNIKSIFLTLLLPGPKKKKKKLVDRNAVKNLFLVAAHKQAFE